MRSALAVTAAAAALTLAACVPPPPPPPPALGGTASGDFEGGVEVPLPGGLRCGAYYGLFIRLDSDTKLFMMSDVLVRGAWTPTAACIYEEWGFIATVECIGPGFTCGRWEIPVPNGDRGVFQAVYNFARRPHNAKLRLTFSAVWIGMGGGVNTRYTNTILCDPLTDPRHRCLFQLNN